VPLGRRLIHQTLQEMLRDGTNKRLEAQAQRIRRQGFGWRFDGLGNWSTADIFARLQKLGIAADEAGFREQALRARRPEHLEEQWRGDREWSVAWDDFPFLAADELWRRLTPDLLCPELVADILQGRALTMVGLPQASKDVQAEHLAAALKIVCYLEQAPAADRPARFDELQNCTTVCICEWLLRVIDACAFEHLDAVASIAELMAQADPVNAAGYHSELAVALAGTDRYVGALQLVHLNLARYPRNAWNLITAGDVYEMFSMDEEALERYVDGLRLAEHRDDWLAAEQGLSVVLSKLGRQDEHDAIVRDNPPPPEATHDERLHKPIGPDLPADRLELPRESLNRLATDMGDDWSPAFAEPLNSAPKVGRNDPCPCGSGKKYKKCCLKP
jgi:hypothetical protein